jgi:hypothetical protein
VLQVAVVAVLLGESATIGSTSVVFQVACYSSSLIPRKNVFLGLDYIPLDEVVLHVHGITISKSLLNFI